MQRALRLVKVSGYLNSCRRNYSTEVVKPPTVWTRFLDHVGEHPWHLGGPILAALFLYALRSVRGSANQDTLIRSLDEVSPLHPREVAILGRDNSVSAEEWEEAWRMVVGAVREKLAVRGTPSALLLNERVYPSEVEAALSVVTEGRPLVHAHMLHRAAAWLAMKEEGLVKVPQSDAEAYEALKVIDLARAGSNWWGEVGVEMEEAGKGSILAGLGRSLTLALQTADADSTLGAIFSVQSADPVTPSPRHWDSPMPLFMALSLYGCVVGGRRAEGEGEGGEGEQNVKVPTPSQRLHIWIEMFREITGKSLGARGEGELTSLPIQDPTDPLSPEYSTEELKGVLAVLGDTFQLPSRVRVYHTTAWPEWHYSLAPPAVILEAALTEASVDLSKSPAPSPGLSNPANAAAEQVPGSVAGIPAPNQPGRKDLSTARDWLTRDEGRRVLLNTRAACAWGECNKRRSEYKGFFS